MRTETATKILDAIASGRIRSLADADAVGMSGRYLSLCVQQLRSMGVEITTNEGNWRGKDSLKTWKITRYGPFARRRK